MGKNESQDSYRAAREESKMPMTSNEEYSYLVKEGEGRRARLSDTLDLLTEPLWESDPDPDVEWIVLKIPRRNNSFFMADFVDGDNIDDKEWLEGPFDQDLTVKALLGIKRRGRAVRRRRGSNTMQSEGQARGRIKPTSRDDGTDHPLRRQADLNRASRPMFRDHRPEKNFAEIIKRGNVRSPPYRFSRTKVERPTMAKPSPVIDLARRSPDEGSMSVPQQEAVRYRLSEGQHLDLESLYEGQRKRQEELLAEESSSDEKGDSFSHVSRDYRIASAHQSGFETQDRPKASSLFQGEERASRWENEYARRRPHMDYVVPAFALGVEVSFCDNAAQVSGSGRITRVIRPSEKGNAYHTLLGALDPDIEVLYEIDSVAISRPGYSGWIRESMMWKSKDAKKRKVTALTVRKSKALHPLDHVGIDTCSAVSVSTEIADFVYLDTSLEARNSLSLNGVGEGGPTILGRGPMVVSTMD